MTFSAYHTENKPWGLKLTSVSVILTFLVTQTDAQLAFGMNAPTAPSPAVSDKVESEDLKDIHYMQDMNQWDIEKSAIFPAGPEQAAGEKPELEEDTTPPIPTSLFEKSVNPLLNPEGEATESEFTDNEGNQVQRSEYANGSFFEVYSGSGSNQGKIKSIGDYTDPTDSSHVRVLSFQYFTDALDHSFVRIVTRRPEDSDTYQTFSEGTDGVLEQLVESGVMMAGRAVKEREYSDRTITHLDPSNPAFKALYEFDHKSETVGRVLQYENEIDGEKVSLEFQYEADAMTTIDRAHNMFSVAEYDPVANQSGQLIRVGKYYDGELTPTHALELTERLSGDKIIPVYNFIDYLHPDYIRIQERLPGGGIGRVLRLLDSESDIEMEYEKESESGNEIMTVYNYKEGTYLKMELEDSSDADRDGLIDNPGILLAAGVIQKGIQRELKTFLVRQDNEFAVTSNYGTTRMYDAMVDNRIGRLQSERGPPDAEGKQLPIRNYRYDDSSKTRTAYDLLTLTYSVTTFENELPGEVLSQGRFEILDDGSYRHIDKSETPDADEVSVYRYDAVEVLDFEYAFDIITQGQPAAALVRNVNLDQLNRLLNLPFEVGVAVRDGLILLFTSGDSQEIRLLDAVRGIVEDADLIAHFQTKQGGARQDGPSQGDFDMATDKIEYVLTTQGVFSYNRNGVTDTFAVEEFHSRLSDLLNSEKESPASVEVFSRLLLNQFITAMDRLSEFGEEEILRFRAGDYTPEEEEAFEFAEDELELRILKDRSDFER